MFDLGIINGRVWIDGTWIGANLYAAGGKIAALSSSLLEASEIADARGALVMPGFIDPHVHFALRVGDSTTADDFASGSRAAAFGGITTFIDFLDPIRSAADLHGAFEERSALARESCVDYSFHATLASPVDGPDDMIEAALVYGIPSVKVFTAYSSSGRRTSDRYIASLLASSATKGTTVLVHAENESMIDTDKPVTVAELADARPVLSETTQVLALAETALRSGGRLYIVHASCGSTVRSLRTGYAAILGKSVFLESCPHYFLFNSGVYDKKGGALLAMVPPLREEEERKLLIANFDAISVIGTDHCAYNRIEKEKNAFMGVGGVEFSFTLMYDLFGDAAIDRFTRNPARIHGLWPEKGNLLPGADADVAIFDPGARWIVGGHHGAADYTQYYEREMRGRIVSVVSRGAFVVREGEFIGGKGRYLRRKQPRPDPNAGKDGTA